MALDMHVETPQNGDEHTRPEDAGANAIVEQALPGGDDLVVVVALPLLQNVLLSGRTTHGHQPSQACAYL